jgi:NAD(P)-dependent dehydrogenase (short-subunit alcohol dehydrogenase family)
VGQAIAARLLGKGMKVAMVGRDEAKLRSAAGSFRAGAGEVLVEPCDVADREAVGALVARVLDRFGSIDVLVCNAGMNVNPRSLELLAPADWDRMLATNLTGAFNLVHFVLPAMRERKRGLVVQICSISGKRAGPLGGVGNLPGPGGAGAWHSLDRDLSRRDQHADSRQAAGARSGGAPGDHPAARGCCRGCAVCCRPACPGKRAGACDLARGG